MEPIVMLLCCLAAFVVSCACSATMVAWLWAVLCLSYVAGTLQNPVNVSVFYESLCPDSISFIRLQLYPTWVKLAPEFLAIDFIPYGKASQRSLPDGHWNFSCQHGSRECDGNKVQACALHVLRNSSALQVEFVNCVMSEQYPPVAGPKCAKSLNISYDPIQECSNGQEGEELLAALGNRTHEFQPNIVFVPTVAFDGVYSADDQTDSLTNFLSVVCRHISGDKPSACQQSR